MTAGLDLLASGASIALTDGTQVSLRYPMRSIALLEARYGSVAAVQGAIDVTGNGAAYGPIVQLIGAGCLGPGGYEPHFREHQDAKGERRIAGDITYRRRTDGADLADLLHPGHLGEYVEAWQTAFTKALEALGNDSAPAGAAPAVETVAIPEVVAVASPGPSSTTSPSVPSTFLQTPSGT